MDDPGPLLEPQIPGLRRYAFALLRNHDAADDLVQDCLERALSRWYLRRPERDLRAWLFTMLRNLYIDSHRRRQRRGLDTAVDEVPPLAVPPEQEVGIEARRTLAALDQLSEPHKSILLLVGVEDLTYEEAARVLGVPIGTVMSRLSRARQQLRTAAETGQPTLLRRVK